MPIRGDRLRWPPRPGKKFSDATTGSTSNTGTRRSLSTDERVDSHRPLRRPDERDESADSQASKPRDVIKQAYDDVESGKEDTDCRNRTSEVLDRASTQQPTTGQPTKARQAKTPQTPESDV